MKMSILGIEYKNIRKISELKLSFVDANGKSIKNNFVMMANGTGKTTTMDRLTVLTAHIKYSANGRSEDPVCASCVAGDLGNTLVGKGDVYASVAGADRILNVF